MIALFSYLHFFFCGKSLFAGKLFHKLIFLLIIAYYLSACKKEYKPAKRTRNKIDFTMILF